MLRLTISYKYLIILGQHIGHSVSNTLISNSWYIFSYRVDLSLMNLLKATMMYRVAFSLFKGGTRRRAPIWFVNLDRHVAGLVITSAMKCGEFYVTDFWVRGFVSNFNSMKGLYHKLVNTDPLIWTRMERGAGLVFSNWDFTRVRRAGAVFISNLGYGNFAAKECIQACVPSVGMVDSDRYSYSVGVPIPANDESMNCLTFYNNVMSGHILLAKFRRASSWHFSLRTFARRDSFVTWLYNYYHTENLALDHLETDVLDETGMIDFLLFSEKEVASTSMLGRGFSVLVSDNFRFKTFSQEIEIFYPSEFQMDLEPTLDIFYEFKRKHMRYSSFRGTNSVIQAYNLFYWRKKNFFRKFFKRVTKVPSADTIDWLSTRFALSDFNAKGNYFNYIDVAPHSQFPNYLLKPFNVERKAKPKYDFLVSHILLFLITTFALRVKTQDNVSKFLYIPTSLTPFLKYLYAIGCVDFNKLLLYRARDFMYISRLRTYLIYEFNRRFIFKWSHFTFADLFLKPFYLIPYYFKTRELYKRFHARMLIILRKKWYYTSMISLSYEFSWYDPFYSSNNYVQIWAFRRVAYYGYYTESVLYTYSYMYTHVPLVMQAQLSFVGFSGGFSWPEQNYIDNLHKSSYYVLSESYN